MQIESRDKPGMDANPTRVGSHPNSPVGLAGQGLRPVDPPKNDPYHFTRLYPAMLGVRLTRGLRDRLNNIAKAADVSASSYVRNLIADACGEEAPVDRESGRRVEIHVPAEDVVLATKMLANLRAVIIDAREMQDGKAIGAIAAMEAQHKRLVDLITKMGG